MLLKHKKDPWTVFGIENTHMDYKHFHDASVRTLSTGPFELVEWSVSCSCFIFWGEGERERERQREMERESE